MERNQNGYPVPGRESGAQRAEGREADGVCMAELPLAYAYVPIQRWQMLYPAEKALSRGTLFEQLDKPMEVYGNEW